MKITPRTIAYYTLCFAIIHRDCVAFAPIHHPHHHGTTTKNRLQIPTAGASAGQAQVGAIGGGSSSSSSSSSGPALSATALQASLFDRFFRVARGNANKLLQQFEDPEKVMIQALDDMQNDLVRVRQTYAEVTATQRRMANSKRLLDSQAEDWYNRAQLALKRSNEGLAREALARREALLNQATGIQNQIDAQANNIDTLYEGMLALEKKITDSKGKKNQMIARARTAKSTQKINDMMSGVTGTTSMDALNRMEEKVLAMEAAAEVSSEMAKTTMNGMLLSSSSSSKNEPTSLEAQFRMLEASDSVDKELEKLKANFLPSSSSSTDPASSAAIKSVARKISVVDQ